MTSPDLSPLLAVAKMRDTALVAARPRPARTSTWPFRTLQGTRFVRVREPLPRTSNARTRTV